MGSQGLLRRQCGQTDKDGMLAQLAGRIGLSSVTFVPGWEGINSRQGPGSGAGSMLALGLGQRWESQEVGRSNPVGRSKDAVTH